MVDNKRSKNVIGYFVYNILFYNLLSLMFFLYDFRVNSEPFKIIEVLGFGISFTFIMMLWGNRNNIKNYFSCISLKKYKSEWTIEGNFRVGWFIISIEMVILILMFLFL